MKMQTLLMSMFVVGMLITGFVAAQGSEYGYAKPVAVKPVAVQAISVTTDQVAVDAGLEDAGAINEIYDEVDKETSNGKAIGFSSAYVAHGWYLYSSNSVQYGQMVRLAWVTKQVASVNTATTGAADPAPTNTKVFARGILQLGGSEGKEVYKLVPSDDVTADAKNLYFIVYKGDTAVGKLSLTKTSADGLKGITLWSGDLALSSDRDGTLTLASNSVSVRKGVENKGDGQIMPYPKDKVVDGKKVDDSTLNSEDYAKKKAEAYNEFQKQQAEAKAAGKPVEEQNSAWARFWSKIFGNKA